MRHLRIHENYYISKLKSSSITVLKGKVFHSTLKACSSEPHFFFFFFLKLKHLNWVLHHWKPGEVQSSNNSKQLISFNKRALYYYFLRMYHSY